MEEWQEYAAEDTQQQQEPDWKTYIGVKMVQMVPMGDVEAERVLGRAICDPLCPREGYLVRYRDGYTSWTPKSEADLAYRKLTPEEKALIR